MTKTSSQWLIIHITGVTWHTHASTREETRCRKAALGHGDTARPLLVLNVMVRREEDGNNGGRRGEERKMKL